MSFEGYKQHFCLAGHLFSTDLEDSGDCTYCQCRSVLCIIVDCTNGFPQGSINVDDLTMIEPERKETCNLGYEHIISPARYKIPVGDEIRQLQHYFFED